MSEHNLSNCWSESKSFLESNYPTDFNALNPPAKDADFQSLKEYFSVEELPPDLEEFYQLNNGQSVVGSSSGRLIYGLPFVPITYGLEMHEGMISSYIENMEFSSFSIISEEIDSNNLSPMSKFPIAGGDDLYVLTVDFSPSAKGRFGQVVFIDIEREIAIKVADSFTQMVCAFRSDLKKGKYDVYSKSGSIHPDQDLDLANWSNNNNPSELR